MTTNQTEWPEVPVINHLENGVTEYITNKAIVRIHSGKLTEEQRREVLEDAARNFLRAIEKNKAQKAKREQAACSGGSDSNGNRSAAS